MRRPSALLLIFFLAGMPALVYQVAWQRTLSLYFGVDIYSTSITVATFMLGLGLGSLFGGHLADRSEQPRVLYSACEGLLGLFGAVSLPTFGMVGDALAGSSLLLVAGANFALLLVPTLLMGMTLPLMCQCVRVTDGAVGQHFSKLYAVNTMGAALGAVLSAYFMIGYLGLFGATLSAAALNIGLSIAALMFIPRRESTEAKTYFAPAAAPRTTATGMLVVTCALLSGATALGYELVWYRMLTVLLHGTVYVFGTILFVFLCGIALGSWAARRKSDHGNPFARFALTQFGIAGYVLVVSLLIGHASFLPGLRHAIGATSLTSFHPAPELFSGDFSLRSIYSLLDIGAWTLLFVGPPTLLMGYGFPQLMRAGTDSVSRLGRSVGKIYLANIIGSTAGSLLVGFWALHLLGTERTLQLLIFIGCLTGMLASSKALSARDGLPSIRSYRLPAIGAACSVVALSVFPQPLAIVRALHYADFDQVSFLVAEDRSGVVALRTQHDIISFDEERQILGAQRLLIDGSTHGTFSGETDDVVLDYAVRIALSAHAAPRRILSIGLGDGKMCAAAAAQPGVEELVVVELNSALPRVLAETHQGEALFASDKVHLIVDDGRRWLLANPDERFDVILMWPLHAAHANSGNLYSAEFFALLRSHLAPGGLIFSRSADPFSTARTIASEFDHVVRLDSYSYVASDSPLSFVPSRTGLSAEEVARQLEADRTTILRETAGAPLNRDFRPNSEYYLTYPYTAWLRTWGVIPDGYRTLDEERLARLVVRE